ncbi:MAG: molybdopterin-guanine dinucleotide biosynthesis protein B [Chloroflexi bacterium]|nr:molybdopterin-guanine dinucleotide biosynthesis protein B [Chloroflexota bacterium]
MSIPIITFVGKSGSGKTTLLEKLVVVLKRQQYKIATIKHHSHVGFDIDVPGKDSWRFAQAGSDHVIIAAPDKIASYHKLDHELSLKEILPEVTDVDLILVEGYRTEHFPTIEVVRSQHFAELLSSPENLIAIVSDLKFDLPVAQFALEDVKGIADFIALQCPEKKGQTVKRM